MKTAITTLAIAILITACGSTSSEQKTESAENTEAKVMDAKATEVTQTGSIADYMKLKDALVKSNAATAKSAAATLGASLTSEGMNTDMIEATKMITSSDDLNAQRTAFKTITDGMIEVLKSNETEEGVYVQFCPMAFDNTGANWISMSEEIRNPYFGDKMLTCGRVTETL